MEYKFHCVDFPMKETAVGRDCLTLDFPWKKAPHEQWNYITYQKTEPGLTMLSTQTLHAFSPLESSAK